MSLMGTDGFQREIANLIGKKTARHKASGVNLTFGASRPVVGRWFMSAALLLSNGGDGWGDPAQADLQALQP